MSASDQQPRPRPLALRIPLAILYWVWWLYVYICVTIVTGALIGAFLFAAIGALTHPDLDILRRIEFGLMDGFYYSGMWSGGLAIVFCFMRAHRLHEQRKRERGDNEPSQTASASVQTRFAPAPSDTFSR